MRACHPATASLRTESFGFEVSMPHLPAFTEGTTTLAGSQGNRNRPCGYSNMIPRVARSDGCYFHAGIGTWPKFMWVWRGSGHFPFPKRPKQDPMGHPRESRFGRTSRISLLKVVVPLTGLEPVAPSLRMKTGSVDYVRIPNAFRVFCVRFLKRPMWDPSTSRILHRRFPCESAFIQ